MDNSALSRIEDCEIEEIKSKMVIQVRYYNEIQFAFLNFISIIRRKFFF